MTSILLCITAGRGPVECRLGVKRVRDEICKEAAQLDLSMAAEPSDGTAPSLIISLEGVGAEAFARSWEGVIQWITRSELRVGVKRKNWFVGIVRLAPPQQTPALENVRFETLTAGGPGGQHQNKTESAVRAIHVPTNISVTARDGRSQHRNKALAISRLQQLLAAINERQNAHSATKGWLNKINIERGKALRVYRGEDFVLTQRR